MGGRMRVALSGVEISVGDRPQPCEAEILSAGAYVLAVTTIVPRLHARLASSYLADLDGAVAISHLWGCRDTAPSIVQRTARLAGADHARACLLDHAAVLREHLAALSGDDVRLELADGALAVTADVWG